MTLQDYINKRLLPPDDNELEEEYIEALRNEDPELSEEEIQEELVVDDSY